MPGILLDDLLQQARTSLAAGPAPASLLQSQQPELPVSGGTASPGPDISGLTPAAQAAFNAQRSGERSGVAPSDITDPSSTPGPPGIADTSPGAGVAPDTGQTGGGGPTGPTGPSAGPSGASGGAGGSAGP